MQSTHFGLPAIETKPQIERCFFCLVMQVANKFSPICLSDFSWKTFSRRPTAPWALGTWSWPRQVGTSKVALGPVNLTVVNFLGMKARTLLVPFSSFCVAAQVVASGAESSPTPKRRRKKKKVSLVRSASSCSLHENEGCSRLLAKLSFLCGRQRFE